MRHWWLHIAHYALPQARGLSVFFLLILFEAALNVLKPWPLKLVVDYVFVGRPLPEAVSFLNNFWGGSSSAGLLGWLAASTVVVFLTHQGVKSVQEYVRVGIGQSMLYHLGLNIFNCLQHLSLRFHGRQRSGDLVRRVLTDSGCISQLIMDTIFPALAAVVSLAFMFAVMWRMNPVLAVIAVSIAPLHMILIRWFNRPMMERSYQQEQVEGEMMALAERTLTTIPLVQAFNRMDYEDTQWKQMLQRTLRAYQRTILAQMQFKVGVSGSTALGTAVVMSYGGIYVLRGALSIGDLIVFLTYVASLYGPMETLSYLSYGYASAAARARRVLEIMKAEEKVQDAPGAKPLPSGPQGVRGFINVEGVTFGYEPGRPVLKDVTLQARPGETVALVGPTGAGKSTLISLILRLFDPWSGRVTIDGMDLRGVELASLRAHVALVLQDPFLLPLTIGENIAYGQPMAGIDKIVEAAVAANAHDFISKMPQGYHTQVGERGAMLSGGQRQMLAIARAFIKNAPILILDEPTSALDAETESRLFGAMERLAGGRTTFVIAHRLSTIRRAGRIVVLCDGKISGQGTHEELLASEKYYELFYRLQQAG
jgi:ATP-binding cassette, subfamily B, bacterial